MVLSLAVWAGNSGGRVPRDQRVHVGDGLGPSRNVEGATEDELSPEDQEALAQAMMRQMQMTRRGGHRPAASASATRRRRLSPCSRN